MSKLHDEGIDLIVTKVEIEYKYPLRSRDEFIVTVAIQREGNARILFIQEIFRMPDLKLIIKARVTGVATRKGQTSTSRRSYNQTWSGIMNLI